LGGRPRQLNIVIQVQSHNKNNNNIIIIIIIIIIMDPLSITAGSASILSTVVTVSLKISQFIGDVRDASADMVLVTRELDSLTGALTQLSNDHDLAARLEAQSGLKEILSSCDKVLARISTLMEKTASGRMSSVRWAMSGRADMGQLRTHLEAYKSALVIVLNVHTA
jgi:type IV secretory pathway TrbF-like protein